MQADAREMLSWALRETFSKLQATRKHSDAFVGEGISSPSALERMYDLFTVLTGMLLDGSELPHGRM